MGTISEAQRANWLYSEFVWQTRIGPAGWRARKVLGVGGYGIVGHWNYEGYNPPAIRDVVVKQALADYGDGLEREAMFLHWLNGTNSNHFVKMYHELAIEDGMGTNRLDQGKVHRIFLEYCESDMSSYISDHINRHGFFTEIKLWEMFHCLALGLLAMDRGSENLNANRFPDELVHFDIKPQNILLGQNADGDGEHRSTHVFKFADYGAAEIVPRVQDEALHEYYSYPGTEAYKLPEQLNESQTEGQYWRPWNDGPLGGTYITNPIYGTHSNVWQIGLIMHNTLRSVKWPQWDDVTYPATGIITPGLKRIPFSTGSRQGDTLGYQLDCDELNGNASTYYSEDLRLLVHECLMCQPEQRILPWELVQRTKNGLNNERRWLGIPEVVTIPPDYTPPPPPLPPDQQPNNPPPAGPPNLPPSDPNDLDAANLSPEPIDGINALPGETWQEIANRIAAVRRDSATWASEIQQLGQLIVQRWGQDVGLANLQEIVIAATQVANADAADMEAAATRLHEAIRSRAGQELLNIAPPDRRNNATVNPQPIVVQFNGVLAGLRAPNVVDGNNNAPYVNPQRQADEIADEQINGPKPLLVAGSQNGSSQNSSNSVNDGGLTSVMAGFNLSSDPPAQNASTWVSVGRPQLRFARERRAESDQLDERVHQQLGCDTASGYLSDWKHGPFDQRRPRPQIRTPVSNLRQTRPTPANILPIETHAGPRPPTSFSRRRYQIARAIQNYSQVQLIPTFPVPRRPLAQRFQFAAIPAFRPATPIPIPIPPVARADVEFLVEFDNPNNPGGYKYEWQTMYNIPLQATLVEIRTVVAAAMDVADPGWLRGRSVRRVVFEIAGTNLSLNLTVQEVLDMVRRDPNREALLVRVQ